MQMNTRSAAAGDSKHLIRLWRACGLLRPWDDPAADIALALDTAVATILIGETRGTVAASVMAGFDGHRGWLHYVAVRPDLRGRGLGRQIVTAAESRLLQQGCPKVDLIVRDGDDRAIDVCRALGYHREPRALLSKWLREPPAPSPDRGPPRLLDVTVSYLEMTIAPKRAPAKPPITAGPLSLQRAVKPTLSFYRYLQRSVGDSWLWWERQAIADEALAAIVQDEAVEIYVLSVGGVPAGFAELDFREMPQRAELAYFGLLPDFIGRGLGRYLLGWAIERAWHREPAPERLTVNTCTLDHPGALSGYQKAGFEIVDRVTRQIEDPLAAGHVPRGTKILSPGYADRCHGG